MPKRSAYIICADKMSAELSTSALKTAIDLRIFGGYKFFINQVS